MKILYLSFLSPNESIRSCLSFFLSFYLYIVHRRILEYIDCPDTLGYIKMTAKNWLVLMDSDYHHLCHWIYLDQSVKKILHIDKFGNSWEKMLSLRPRVRLNGFYSLLTAFWKPPNNDAFWEGRRREFIEVKFYRHIRFFAKNKVLYSLDNIEPRQAYTYLRTGIPIPKRVFEGTYSVSKDVVNVEVPTHYCILRFKMQIQDADDRYVGKFNVLRILEHCNRGLDDPPGNNEVSFNLPSNTDMVFYRYWDMN